jgi:tartrate-resistant acid phosphatase type 5
MTMRLALSAALLAGGCAGETSTGSPPERARPDAQADATPEADSTPGTDTADVEETADVREDLATIDILIPDPEPDVATDADAHKEDADAAPTVDVVPDAVEEFSEIARLILVGDTGEGNETQYAVAAAIGAHCDARGGCDAMLLTGDNIYHTGPSSADDPLLEAYIDAPYRPLRQGPPPESGEDTRPRLPVFATLGNHDLGGAGLDASLAQHYIDYASVQDWFHFPSRTWEMRIGPVHIIALDTNPLAYLGTEVTEQGRLIERVVAETDARWTMAVGHHPYRSNGPHGNAGSYESIPGDLVFLGGRFREFVDDYICDDVDFYLCGHDHSRQWLRSVPDIPTWPFFPAPTTRPCFARFGVSGAGAKSSDLEDRDNDMAFESLVPGFIYMEFGPDSVLIEVCAQDGTCEHTETWR